MYTVLLSTIGSGVTPGLLGIRPGTGVTGPDGGTHTLAGRMITTGIIAMLSITIITTARSVTVTNRVEVIKSYMVL